MSENQEEISIVQNCSTAIKRVQEEIGKQVVGQSEVVEQLLIGLIAGGHVLLEGVPGLGKTLMVRCLAATFGGDFSRVQFTPDLMPSDVTGHAIYDMQTKRFEIRKGPAFTNMLLADEINRASAKTQAALLEVMQERQITIEGNSFEVGEPFMVMATQNPIEQEGTYPLPEAELDRFMLNVLIEYPEEQEEIRIAEEVSSGKISQAFEASAIKKIVMPEDIIKIRKVAQNIVVDKEVVSYAVRIARITRDWSGIARGVGPRASIALIAAAKAKALIEGLEFITPDHVKSVALPVLRHRLLLAPELEIEGTTTDQVIEAILDTVEAPRK